jgi:hypothetical protein
VTPEDALGFLVPIPVKLVNPWDVRIKPFENNENSDSLFRCLI